MGLSNVQINQDFFFFKYTNHINMETVEEFVMFTLIYFNRSQHAFGFPGTFKIFPSPSIFLNSGVLVTPNVNQVI